MLFQNVLFAAATSAGKLRSSSFGPPTNAFYDYVIIGGGTAGNAIAARLAENASISVAIIEAGGFYEVGKWQQKCCASVVLQSVYWYFARRK
jgi:choline dehydrogenase